MINLPQRFQAVDGDSPFQAGLRLLPLLLCSPVATAVSGQVVSKLNIPPFYVMLTGASLQVLGIGLASSVGVDDRTKIYGYEVIMGCSFGTVLVTLLIYVPMVVDRSDMGMFCFCYRSWISPTRERHGERRKKHIQRSITLLCVAS